jgi:OOP family OmpA-OmpF porin
MCPDTPLNTIVDTSGCPLTDDSVQDAVSIHVRFSTGTTQVDSQSQHQLEHAAQFLKRYPDSSIRIEGHTDSTGSEAHNLKLSQQRAEQIRTLLIKQFGANPAQLIAKGFGESKPIAPNDTPEGRLANRRVVISVLR